MVVLLYIVKIVGVFLTISRTFGKRMAKSKFEYVREFESEIKCLPNSWIVIRLDGKGFHKFSDCHNFEKPNDKRALDLMTKAAACVFDDLNDICLAFGHSDEYSFVLKKNTLNYNRRHDKLLSLVTSVFSSAYVLHWSDYFDSVKLQYPPSFDGRIILYPTNENLRDYISWRQADVHVNNLHNTVFWLMVLKKNMSTKEADQKLQGTLSSDKNEILFSEFNVNYNNEPEQFKKGTTLVRKVVKNPEHGKLVSCVVPLYCDVIKNKFWEENAEILEGSDKEKEVRAVLKSEALRLLGRENIVILDAGNYIKGYRYELYCASKNSKTTQVTVECAVSTQQAWQWNLSRPETEQYNQQAFDALVMRYEAPDSRNRWDSPLITLQPDDNIPGDELFDLLYHRRPPPPNQSTQSAPLSSTNFLYELDRVTQEIVTMILSAQRLGVSGEVKVPGYEECVLHHPGTTLSPAQLARHRRQFLSYTRLNPPARAQAAPHQLAQMFVQFLNTTLSSTNL